MGCCCCCCGKWSALSSMERALAVKLSRRSCFLSAGRKPVLLLLLLCCCLMDDLLSGCCCCCVCETAAWLLLLLLVGSEITINTDRDCDNICAIDASMSACFPFPIDAAILFTVALCSSSFLSLSFFFKSINKKYSIYLNSETETHNIIECLMAYA